MTSRSRIRVVVLRHLGGDNFANTDVSGISQIVNSLLMDVLNEPFHFKTSKLKRQYAFLWRDQLVIQRHGWRHLGFRRRGAAFVCVPHLRARYCQCTLGRGLATVQSVENVRLIRWIQAIIGRNRSFGMVESYFFGWLEDFCWFFKFPCRENHDWIFFFAREGTASDSLSVLRLLWLDFSRRVMWLPVKWLVTIFQVLWKWMVSFSKLLYFSINQEGITKKTCPINGTGIFPCWMQATRDVALSAATAAARKAKKSWCAAATVEQASHGSKMLMILLDKILYFRCFNPPKWLIPSTVLMEEIRPMASF